MRNFALTYAQFINQCIAADFSFQDLNKVSQAYELALKLFDGPYRVHKTPFICHLTRTSSILLGENQPIDVLTAGFLHAVYMNGVLWTRYGPSNSFKASSYA